jgi:hypothetical protein
VQHPDVVQNVLFGATELTLTLPDVTNTGYASDPMKLSPGISLSTAGEGVAAVTRAESAGC